MLPDLVDKLLMWTAGTTGRSCAHNLLFMVLAGLPFLLARRVPLAYSVWLGGLIHLVLDIPAVPWFFPFISYDLWGAVPDYAGGFWEYFVIGLTQPVTFVTEIGGLVCPAWLIWRYKLLSKKGWISFFGKISPMKIDV